MALNQQEIDRLVREVLRRLTAEQPAVTPATTAQPAAQPGATPPTSAGQLRLSLPVVTLERVTGKLANIKSVVVPRGAVVTPAVKDLLRQQNISLQFEESSNTTKNGAALGLAIGLADANYDSAAIVRSLKQDGVAVEELARTGTVTVTEELAEQVARGGKLGLLLTGNVSAAVCLGNRWRGVRAAEARCATSTREAVKSVGVNLLVVNPSGKSTFELKRMVSVLLAGGGSCPAEWRGRLD